MNKASTVTFNNPHSARAINTALNNQNKRKKKEGKYIPLHPAMQDESLNILPP
jgi:hypothetical protein